MYTYLTLLGYVIFYGTPLSRLAGTKIPETILMSNLYSETE